MLVFISTALLICTENTFWDINGDGNFVELFEKSFTLYVESGVREMTERDVDILKNEQGGFSVRDLDFSAKFYKFIVDHYLRKFHCFYLHLTSSNHCLWVLNTAQPGESRAHASGESESRASEEQASEGQVLALEQKTKKKLTWLQELKRKFRRRQRA